ncbi:MAG: 16S rRNA processing protein RimM [Deltaproteobacteria bacterium]|nr:16S rRNA processing protein RimM [Deltaproteobacteria bacterium]
MRESGPHGAPAPGPRNPSGRGVLEIGVVTRPQGLRGEVRVHLYNRESTALDELEAVLVRRRDEDGVASAEPLKLGIEGARSTPDGTWIVAFAGVVSRNDAESLRGATVSARRADLPGPDEGELYVEDLVGLQAVDPGGRPLGVVRDVYDNGAQEVLVVAAERGDVEVPFVDAHVGEVDPENRRLVILDLEALIPEP